LTDVLDALPVGEVAVSPGFGADPLPAALVARCRARGVPVTVVARGDEWRRRGVDVRVLSPCADVPAPRDNEASIVAHVTVGYGERRVTAVIPGDVDGRPLHALGCDATAPPARVLVLPHHGRGDRDEQLALAARLGAVVLVASTSPSAPMTVPEAFVTGRDGAIRVRANEAPAAFPWDTPGR
jgi:beta-lactamase superfamily II metal-dependent hydrolase